MSDEKRFLDDPFAEDFEVDETGAEDVPYPVFQWYTGKGEGFKAIHPVVAFGGFELPLDDFGNLVDNSKYTVTEIPHKNNTEVGYLAPMLHLSVLAMRSTWKIRRDGQMVNLGNRYETGAHKRIQVLCLVKEFGPEPVVFSIKGNSGGCLEKTIASHLKQVIVVARKLGGKKYSQSYFFIPLKAGPPTESGKGDNVSTITPPTAAWDQDLFVSGDLEKCRDPIRSLYVGAEFLKVIKEMENEAYDWKERWNWKKVSPDSGDNNDQAPATNGNPPLDPQIHYFTVCTQNNIDIPTAQEALIRANGDHMVALTLLPMKQIDAIKGMNPPEGDEPTEEAF